MCRYLKARREIARCATGRLNAACLLVIVGFLLNACGHNTRAPITDKSNVKPATQQTRHKPAARAPLQVPQIYTVKRGDTLQAIAWQFGLDHKSIARWNNIRNPNLIYVGQRLKLKAPKSARNSTPEQAKKSAVAPKKRQTTQAATPIKWRWPANGKVASADSALGSKGIEIHGKRGSAIIAAARGKVVYSGNGLRGYGNLIIIQHDATFLSAYAHNEKILVSEGASVAAGETIGTMGNSGTKQVMLHFEIRRNGKAVEPTNYLPRR